MNEKQQQLTFDKGITNVPSDALCSDNALEESLGMVYDNGEHRVIQKPVVHMSSIPSPYRILYIHRFNDEVRYIIFGEKKVKWGTNVNGVYTPAQETVRIPYGQDAWEEVTQDAVLWTVTGNEMPKIESIGKTLIISDNEGMHYSKWKVDSYKILGDKIPDPKFDFWLTGNPDLGIVDPGDGAVTFSGGSFCATNTRKTDGIFNPSTYEIEEDEAYNDLIVGMYSKNVRSIETKGGFCKPFFVRTALRMYDGTYTHISQPILMFPSITRNTWFKTFSAVKKIKAFTKYCYLNFSQSTEDLSDWEDIIKEVDIFVSSGIDLYDLNVDQVLAQTPSSDIKLIDGVFSTHVHNNPSAHLSIYQSAGHQSGRRFLKSKAQEEIIREICATSIFYNICSIGLKAVSGKSVNEFMESGTLSNLTSRMRLDNDDYYSRCKLVPNFLYSYNSRLNIAGVSRGFFDGFDFFLAMDTSETIPGGHQKVNYIYDIYVTIDTDSGEFVVHHQSESISHYQGLYFYYPDSRAKKVVIWRNKQDAQLAFLIADADLTEHPSLNGAYYFAGLPADPMPTAQTSAQGSDLPTSPAPHEILPNYILQSEVNNPWVYPAAGYFKVGTGKIIGMSAITQALSEGQFGSYPLLVFSESGIWALSVASTGYYDTVHPMSREVSLDPACIVQTDGAVFFTSEKGLMVVVGNQVKCVSEQLSGKDISFMVDVDGTPAEQTVNLGNFTEYLRSAYIAYDYRDSLLWIFNANYDACWVYSIKSGTFGKYDFGTGKRVNNVVNLYPDYLMQNADGVLSLLERPDINNDGTTVSDVFTPNTYNTKIITRPMKFENALALKSIMQIRHIKDFTPYTTTETVNEGTENEETITHKWPKTELRIFASNNMDHWAELGSLRGMPWKYYKFRFDFTGLKATDRFSGSMLVTQERRINKMR